ncbi:MULTISPECIES: hypothetical protein [unclassified Lactococcus]|uniref:hypothetical protein n=1 Tax=unclassified Lactococcus TaxID=2643510 RepID=UPI001297C9B8|nr:MULTISPECIES: hypothetical protein [unclassified Lactococcus]MQW23826.1 hypothetical protein [Lactococcus sp. dk101]
MKELDVVKLKNNKIVTILIVHDDDNFYAEDKFDETYEIKSSDIVEKIASYTA